MRNIQTTPKAAEQRFHAIVNEHADRIYNLALMKCGEESLAQDICQETFIRVYKGLQAFRAESQIGTWIYRIALNVCHTQMAREIKRGRLADPIEYADDVLSSDLGDPVVEVEREVKAETIRKAIASLPEHQATAVSLFYLKEFKYTEVAEIMDLPLNTVKSHLRRAKTRLRDIIPEDL